MQMAALKNRLRQEGKPVFDFGAGEPDFATPEPIKKAGIAAIRADFTRYTAASGIPELKSAIRSSLLREQGVEVETEQVLVVPGSKFGLFALLQAVVGPGDEVILPLPYWVSYPEMVRFCGGQPVFADHLSENPRFEISAASYIDRAGPQTRAVLINSPANPSGVVMKERELLEVIDTFAARNILVIVDDCYRHILFGDLPYPAPLRLRPQYREWIAVVSSLSKSYAMTGWRIGYVIAPVLLCAAMTRICEHSLTNTCSISQKAAVTALSKDFKEISTMRHEYHRRRDLMAERLGRISGLTLRLPEGAFYCLVDFSSMLTLKGSDSDRSLARSLAEETGVITVPGSAFGASGFLRFSFATSEETIRRGMDQLEDWLAG